MEENYTVTFSVTYLETGLISLAASEDLIESVTCSHGNVDIEFKQTPSADMLDSMFPESALLVVDGGVFGSCDVGPTIPSDVDIEGAGFLAVQTTQQSGATVSFGNKKACFVPCLPMYTNRLFGRSGLSYGTGGHL